MKFAHIEMLLCLWLLPVLAFVFWRGMRRRNAILSAHASFKNRRTIVTGEHPRRRMLKAALLLAAVLLLVIAMAGPRYGYKWREIERRGIDIIIALDCSKSMLAADIKPSRLDRAKREIIDLLALLKGDRAGLVAFAGTAFLQCPLTLDYEAFHLFLNALTPDFLPLGGSRQAAAIETAISGFDPQSNAEKAIILITDGESTGGDPVKAAEAAAKAGIKLFCIGVGKAEGIPIPDSGGGFKKDDSGSIILSRIDEDLLKKIALMTGGAYVRSVAGDMDLDLIYTREIKGKMEAASLTGGRKKVWEDRYQWFLGLAVLCLLIELFVPSGRKVPALLMMLALITAAGSPASAETFKNPLRDGLAAYEAGDYETALNAFIKTQLDDPERPEIYYNLGNTYYKLGKYDAARSHYEKALDSEKSDLRQKTYYNLGNTDFRAGKAKEALKNYEAALKLDPNDRQAESNIEFVKKVMKQQKQQPSPQKGEKPPNDSGKDQKPQKEPSAPSDEKKQKDPGAKEEQPPNEKGADSRRDETQPENSDQQESGSNGSQESKDDSNQEEGQAEASPPSGEDQESGNPADAAQAQPASQSPEEANNTASSARMLNRLKDKPGRAMIPVYRKRAVEKDW